MSDIGDVYRAMRDEQRERRAARLPIRTDEILALQDAGFTVRKLTDYQFRVNEAVDLYPIHRRYHFLKSHRRGQYRNALAFVQGIFREGGR